MYQQHFVDIIIIVFVIIADCMQKGIDKKTVNTIIVFCV